MNYLNGTQELHLLIRYDGMSIVNWHADASFGVHIDFKYHSGGMLL